MNRDENDFRMFRHGWVMASALLSNLLIALFFLRLFFKLFD